MSKFIDRQPDLRNLNALRDAVKRGRGAQFGVVYGRRRVGKTTLLLHWALASGLPYVYWLAKRESPDATRHGCARALWRWAYPDEADPEPPRFDSWTQLFEQMARLIGQQPVILIFDEFAYAVESDPALPSHLQAAWDHLFQELPVILLLSGSHIGMMVELLNYNAPLYGRMTAQLPVEPLPFAALSDFFPRYSAAERVALYATVGGVPAYLERFDPGQTLTANIKEHLFQRTGMFRNEPTVIVSDLARETRQYEAVLRAIAAGQHTPAEIGETMGVASPNLSPYLKRLTDLGLIERRVPATLPQDQRRTTTRSRYHLRDSYLRFYFRFVDPNIDMIEQGLQDALWQRLAEQYRAFVGLTAFEEICRAWTLTQARTNRLPFMPEVVGSHWATDAQVDVVAASWHDKTMLLGECKWGDNLVGRAIIRELVDKVPLVLPEGWTGHLYFFARDGFTEAAQAEAEALGAHLVTLADVDATLRRELTG